MEIENDRLLGLAIETVNLPSNFPHGVRTRYFREIRETFLFGISFIYLWCVLKDVLSFWETGHGSHAVFPT